MLLHVVPVTQIPRTGRSVQRPITKKPLEQRLQGEISALEGLPGRQCVVWVENMGPDRQGPRLSLPVMCCRQPGVVTSLGWVWLQGSKQTRCGLFQSDSDHGARAAQAAVPRLARGSPSHAEWGHRAVPGRRTQAARGEGREGTRC